MVGIYFRTHRLPVRFLIYVAITALTRMLVIDAEKLADQRVLTITGAILILALASLAVDFSAARFRPADQDT
jgi:phosphate starvation-inducible membrane PsiE